MGNDVVAMADHKNTSARMTEAPFEPKSRQNAMMWFSVRDPMV